MTVTTNLIILAVLMVPVALVVGALFNAKADADIQRRINTHNNQRHADEMALLISAIVAKANLPGEPPPLDPTKWSALLDLYDDLYLMPYPIPAQITTDIQSERAVVYWKVTNINELDTYVIARLWLAGVL